MSRIRVIFIGHEQKEFIEEQKKYRELIVSKDSTVEIRSIEQGPETIEQSLDEVLAAPAILREVLLAEKEGADAVIVDCALDPILSASRQAVRIPVIGAGQAAYALAVTLGDRFSILGPLRCLVPEYRRRIQEYGLSDRLASIRSIDVEILDLLSDQAIQAFVREGRSAIDKDQADVLVLGCTGMSPAMPRLRQMLEVPVVDPASAAIALAETLIRLSLTHSSVAYPYKRIVLD
ncbi:MAG: aspartate/glutamate racemase family protein [Chloroflexi bacterium]|nr:aspartate/glutamate racemase family protein [Chloroflexota bacterium]